MTVSNERLSLVAHDLRNPLMSIMQSVELARRRPEAERLRKELDVISRAATRIDQLIQRLLEASDEA